MNTNVTRMAVFVAVAMDTHEQYEQAVAGMTPEVGTLKVVSKIVYQLDDVVLFDYEGDQEAFTFENADEAEFAFVMECNGLEAGGNWRCIATIGTPPDQDRCKQHLLRELGESLGMPKDLIDALAGRGAHKHEHAEHAGPRHARREESSAVAMAGTGFYL